MNKTYIKLTEQELKDACPDSLTLEECVDEYLNDDWNLVSVSYVGGCRASGYHVYHFVKEL